MCEPTTALMGLSTGLQIAGTYQRYQAQGEAGKAQRDYYDFLAGNSEKQANLVEKTAGDQKTLVQDQAARDAKAVRDQGNQVAASQKAAMAKNGVIGGATAEDIARDTFNKQKMDELSVRYSADLRNWEIENESRFKSWDLRNQAHGYRKAGANAMAAAKTDQVSTLLGGASSVASSWATYGKR